MLEPGQVIERYTVEHELGAGGMATVYLVRHNALGSYHALKLLNVQRAEVAKRLMHEGRIQATLRHPNIVAVTDVIDVAGAPGLVLEYIAGPTLEAWLHEHTPSLAQAEAIFRGILAGVARAHRAGLVHRDLKPGNVLLDPGDDGLVPKVTDFGLVKVLEDDEGASHTRSGIAMGTPAYMAPEQIRDAKNVDRRADIFALGCILYELVCGRPPFRGDDTLATYNAIAGGDYPPPEDIVAGLPPPIAAAIRGCLEVDRERRFTDCGRLREVLTGHAAGPPVVARPVAPRADPMPPPAARHRWRFALVAGAVAVAAGVLGAVAAVRPPAPVVDVLPPAAPLPPPDPVAAAPSVAPAPAPPARRVAPTAPAVVQPAVTDVAAPAVAEPALAEPAATVLLGTVTVTGSAEQVWLDRASEAFPPGPVPPGIYRIRARFPERGEVDAGRVGVRAGESVTVNCSDQFFMCRAQP